jgi:hypothetical protein
MYGLLLQSAVEIIRAKYGQETWEQIKLILHLDINSFSAFQQYGETLFVRIAKILSEIKSRLLSSIEKKSSESHKTDVYIFQFELILEIKLFL